jgi:nitroreductase
LLETTKCAAAQATIASMERIADHEINRIFLDRWSPRAMSGEPVSEADLMRLFEAARWAPSSGNFQPWRFIYARAKTPHFPRLFDLLVEANRPWCERAGALVVVISKSVLDNGNPARTHSYDTGAAWMNLALQGSSMGLVTHGMAGFDYARARTELAVPDEYTVEAMIAIGHQGNVEDLPEKYREREVKSNRRPARESVFEGHFRET